MKDGSRINVVITDPEHPHQGCSGYILDTDSSVRSVLGKTMVRVELMSCQHGVDACFISRGQATELADRRRRG